MKEVRLDQNRVFIGQWTVDDHGGISLPGELSFAPSDGLRLRLFWPHEFDDPFKQMDWFANHRGIVTIRGVDSGSLAHLLMVGCFVTKVGGGIVEYRVQSAYVSSDSGGSPPPNELAGKATVVNSITVGIANLDALLGWPDFEQQWGSGQPAVQLLPLPQQTKDRTQGRVPSIASDIKFHPLYVSGGIDGDGKRGRRISASLAMELAFDKPKTVADAYRLASHTQLFFDLLIGCHSPAEWRLLTVGSTQFYSLGGATTRLIGREAYGQAKCPVSSCDFLNVLDTWLAFGEGQASILARLAALLWKRSSLMDDEFGSAIQAVEGLGRFFHNAPYLPDGDFDELKKRLQACMAEQPEDLQRRAEGSFAHLNSPSLITLLRRLLEDLPQAIAAKVIGIEDPEECSQRAIKKFAQRVSKARNSQSHGREVDAGEEPLRRLVDRLKTLIIVIMLRHAGISDDLLQSDFAEDPANWRWG